ncbi:MAG: hypothetical protein MK020_07050 [Dehalococcoidia bacterium]|nr:hypothetical protein [Dehalococcoidia bacterium]
MNTRSLTGLSLIVGPILTVLCWIIFYGTTSWNPTESTANIANMGAEADMAKILLTLATVGTLLSVIGVAGLKHIMSDGAGNHFALAGLLVFTLGVAIGTGESALILGSADAFNAGEGAAAESLYFASQAIGSMGWSILFLGFGIIGYAILVQKNFNPIIAILTIVIGVFGFFMAAFSYDSEILAIGYVGHALLFAVIGACILRSSD